MVTRWIGPADDGEWAALFTGYRCSAYRLEAQQVYSSPEEDAALTRWLAGDPHGIDLSWTTSKTQAQVEAGRRKVKVRVVVEPPTDYTRFELSLYPAMADAGEEIRILTAPYDTWPTNLPRYDFWLFDETDVWRLHYDADSRFAGAELLNHEYLDEHLAFRDTALALAVPLETYLAAPRTVR